MPIGRKFVYFVVLIALLVCLFSVWNQVTNQYESMKQALERTNIIYLETRSQLESLIDKTKKCPVWDPDLPVVYAVTPTYARPVQEAELTRLSQTFSLVPNFHWILVEDASVPSSLVTNLLKTSGLNYTHLVAATPPEWKIKPSESRHLKPRGVSQRNAGIKWLRENRNKDADRGVVYFADDDNTYSLKLFQEMRYIKKVGFWPVGLIGGLLQGTPLIDPDPDPVVGRVIDRNSPISSKRDFAIDMSGFAVNLQHLLGFPEAEFSFSSRLGHQESSFLLKIISLHDLEPKAENCTKVYVWHTRTEKPFLFPDEMMLFNSKLSSNETDRF